MHHFEAFFSYALIEALILLLSLKLSNYNNPKVFFVLNIRFACQGAGLPSHRGAAEIVFYGFLPLRDFTELKFNFIYDVFQYFFFENFTQFLYYFSYITSELYTIGLSFKICLYDSIYVLDKADKDSYLILFFSSVLSSKAVLSQDITLYWRKVLYIHS